MSLQVMVKEARVAIVGEFATEMDLAKNTPINNFEFSKMLGEAGIHREQCFVTLVIPDRVPRGRVDGVVALKKKDVTPQHVFFNGKMVLPQVVAGAERLKNELLLSNPNVVCAVGNLALFVLTGEWGVGNWRSSIMESTLIPGMKVIPTYSPQVLFAQWKLRPIIVHDLKRVSRHQSNPLVSQAHYSFVIRPSYTQAISKLNSLIIDAKAQLALGKRLKLGGDIETRAGHISCIAFAWSSTEAICIPLMCQHKEIGYWELDEEVTLVHMIMELMSLVTIVGQNWNYDAQYIERHWAFQCPSVVDTMVQQHTCFSNLDKNLAFLSSMYLEDHLYWKDDRTNWTEGPKGEGEDAYWVYNCTDAVRTLAIHDVLNSVVKALNLEGVNEFQQHLANGLALQMMLKGVRVDITARDAFGGELTQEFEARNAWLESVIGHPVNIKSPKQMQELFYDELGQKEVTKRGPDGSMNVTTNDEALHKIADREPILLPITRKISELRSIGVFNSTFVKAPLDADGRLRSSFNTCGTDTYRFASSQSAFNTGLNFQNIPKGGETEDAGLDLPNVRKLFIPDEGMTMFDTDLDSADLHIVTWESDCKWMKEQFKLKNKPYVEIMKEYYHNQSMNKNSHPREYAMFKSLCHGTNYLGTAQGIAPRIGLLVHETERIQEWYFGLCPEIKKWQEEIKLQVSGRRYVTNAFGYRYNIFDKIEGTIFNQAIAWIPQSTVACLINRIWNAIDLTLPEIEILIQVHDSLVGQFPTLNEAEHKALLERIIQASRIVIPYAEPLVIPIGIACSTTSWGDCR